jgi:hypothetical protein
VEQGIVALEVTAGIHDDGITVADEHVAQGALADTIELNHV